LDAITGSLERVVAILDLFAGMRFRGDLPAGQASLGVTDVSRQLHLPKGTVSRYLSRMEEVGILQRLPDRRYVLGNRVYDWGQAAAPGQDVRPWARPVMEMLAREHGETVSLMVRDGDEAVCIDQVDGLFPIRLSAVRGRRLSLYTGASPRLLLAFAPEDEREDYISRCNFIRERRRDDRSGQRRAHDRAHHESGPRHPRDPGGKRAAARCAPGRWPPGGRRADAASPAGHCRAYRNDRAIAGGSSER
jgi:DNA-binding IclR family transcriptional regulator